MGPTHRKVLLPTLVLLLVPTIAAGFAFAGSGTSAPMIGGYALPASLDGGHFLLAPTKVTSTMSLAAAVTLAREYAGDLAVDPSGISAQMAEFTDTSRLELGEDGVEHLAFAGVAAWIVRFTGVPQPIFGPLGASSAPPATELNVVMDATTGAYLEMFSFR